jgi:hypothetical protein
LGSISSLVVWAAHFAVVYSLVGVGCERGWQRVSFPGTNGLSVLLLAVTLPALVLIAWIGWCGWRGHRKARASEAGDENSGRWRFLGLVTLALAVFAFVSTIMTSVPIMMLPPCN